LTLVLVVVVVAISSFPVFLPPFSSGGIVSIASKMPAVAEANEALDEEEESEENEQEAEETANADMLSKGLLRPLLGRSLPSPQGRLS